MYGLTRGGLEVVAWGSGFRQAGERRSVIGKDTEACGNRPEYRCSGSSDLWSIPQGGIRHPVVGFALLTLCKVVAREGGTDWSARRRR